LHRLYAWTLTRYHRVVHVDVDTLVLQPIDELLGAPPGVGGGGSLGGPAEEARPPPEAPEVVVDLVYTADYNMMSTKQRRRGVPPAVQGGFLVATPNASTFEALRDVAQGGRWGGTYGAGWERSNIGHWWGGATIQGLLPFFFAVKKPGAAREVDRCVYDNMIDRPVRDPPPRVGAEACRDTPLADIKVAHFTVCQKPWSCRPRHDPDDTRHLCRDLHATWFAHRRHLEARLGLTNASNDDVPCRRRSYLPIAFPDDLRLLPR